MNTFVGGISQADIPKIDGLAVNGLVGVSDSLAYRVHEIERHLHSYEHWFGLAAVPDGETHRADHMTMTPFQMDAGNDTWGTWLQTLGSGDTPHVGTNTRFDLHRLQFSDVEIDKTLTLIQIGFGASGAAALSSDDITEFLCTPLKDGKQDPCAIQCRAIAAGTKMWARCWVDGQNTSTVDFHFALHEYEG